MKVPQYRSKMPLPKRTGAGTLTAQASPGIWGAPGAAKGEFGKTAATEAQLWGTFLLKTERATEQAKYEKQVDDLIRITRENAERQSADSWKDLNDPRALSLDPAIQAQARTMGYYARRDLVREELSAASDRLLQGIPDRVVRQRMTASVQTKLTTAMSNIEPTLQRQYLDYAKTGILQTSKDAINAISTQREGPLKERAIDNAIGALEYFRELNPLLSKEYLWKATENFKSDLGAHTLRREFTKIKTHDDAVAWLNQLSDPKKGNTGPGSFYHDVKRLNDKQRTTFIERLQRTALKLSRSENSAEDRKIRTDAWKRTQEKKKNFEGLSSNALKIIRAELKGYDVDDPQWPKNSLGNPLKPQTAFDVLAIPPSDLDTNQRNSLLDIINQKDLEVDSLAFYRHSTEIREAFNEDDLGVVERSIEKKRENRTMSYGTYDSLRTLLNNRRDQTPGYKEQEVYGKLLNEIMNKAGVTVDLLTKIVGADPTERALQGDITSVTAKMRFSDLIERGDRPVEAFYKTIETFVKDEKKLAENVFKLLDKDMLVGVGDDVINDIVKLTDEHVDIIRENFRAHARGRKVAEKISKEATVGLSKGEMAELQRKNIISFDQRKTMRELIKIERTIAYLKEYAPVPKVPLPSNVELTEPGSKEEAKGVFDGIQDWYQEWFGDKPGGRADRSGEIFTSGGR